MKPIKNCHSPHKVVAGRTQSKNGRIQEYILLENQSLFKCWLHYDSDKRKRIKYRIEVIAFDYCPKCKILWDYIDKIYFDEEIVLKKTTAYLLHNPELKKTLRNKVHAHFYWELRLRIKRHLEDWDGEGNVRWIKKNKNKFLQTHSVNFFLNNDDFKYKVQLPNKVGSWWDGLSRRATNNQALLWFFDNHGTNFSTFKLVNEEVWLQSDEDLLYFKKNFQPDNYYDLDDIRVFKKIKWEKVK